MRKEPVTPFKHRNGHCKSSLIIIKLLLFFFKMTGDWHKLKFTDIVHTPVKFQFEVALNLSMHY